MMQGQNGRRGADVSASGGRAGSASNVAACECGMTLIELMMVLLVLAILLNLAAPPLSAMVRDTRLATRANDFLAALIFTRSEAIKRGRRVTMCTSSDGATCEDSIGWHRGWIVFVDANGNAERDASETILRIEAADSSAVRITGTGYMRDYVSYIATGSTRAVNDGLLMATITLCDDGVARKIVINRVGRPRVVREAGC